MRRLRGERQATSCLPVELAECIPFFDASRVFADVRETLYYDLCHFDQKGSDILADAVVEAFLASLP